MTEHGDPDPGPSPERGPSGTGDGSYEEIFRKALVGCGVTDLEGNLLAFNDAMLVPGGYTRREVEGLRNVGRFYADPADRDRVLDKLRRQGQVRREEVRFRRKDGSSYDALLSLIPVRFRGRDALLATVEDITELKREQSRRRAIEDELWKAQNSASVGELAAGIAHDLKNVLSVIVMDAELLRTAIDPADEEAMADLASLREAARQASAVIKRLLALGRKDPIQIGPARVPAIVEGITEMVRPTFPPSVVVRFQADPATPEALCDAGAVEQIVLNLVTNARDALSEGGSIAVSVEGVSVENRPGRDPEWLASGRYVRISVVDDGTGMNEEALERAFEPFFTTKPSDMGTGLGLPTVYSLVKQQHGYVRLRSELGAGTRAEVYLPEAR